VTLLCQFATDTIRLFDPSLSIFTSSFSQGDEAFQIPWLYNVPFSFHSVFTCSCCSLVFSNSVQLLLNLSNPSVSMFLYLLLDSLPQVTNVTSSAREAYISAFLLPVSLSALPRIYFFTFSFTCTFSCRVIRSWLLCINDSRLCGVKSVGSRGSFLGFRFFGRAVIPNCSVVQKEVGPCAFDV